MPSQHLNAGLATTVHRTMARIQACDQAIQRGLASGALQFQYHPCGGQEAIPAAIAPLLTREDFFVTTYRGVQDVIARGTPIGVIRHSWRGCCPARWPHCVESILDSDNGPEM